MLNPAQSDTMPCEYLSLDAMEKWIIFGFILCHGILNTDATALNLWKLALQSSSCLSLFRDEVFHIHKAAEDLFVNIRGYVIFNYFVFFGEKSPWGRVSLCHYGGMLLPVTVQACVSVSPWERVSPCHHGYVCLRVVLFLLE